MRGRLTHFLRTLPLLILSLPALVAALFAVALADLAALLFCRRRAPSDTAPRRDAASVVIPNWNGRDLLEKYLPSVIAATRNNPDNEIIVVDNGSSDGSVDLVREYFPEVRLLALESNLGFGGGSNAGFRAAANDIVVLLNSDMRVESGFLQPLLDGFTDERVFAVTCQIFFSDPARKREETGLTQARWHEGGLRVRHRIDDALRDVFPCFYAGGGSSAFDRRKFLELGGFDPLLAPFYLEDTDLGYMAWKRGWKVLYQPRSVVYHEHRGTIGRNFSQAYIQGVYKKNFLLFAWKNIHEFRKTAAHFAFILADVLLSALFGDVPGRGNAAGLCRACAQLPRALGARWRARALATVNDAEAFRRPLGGYFRDRFALSRSSGVPEKPRVLFVSPYPIHPPVHGGAVFMNATLRELARRVDVHLLSMLDRADQLEANREMAGFCASAEFVVRSSARPRMAGAVLPRAVHEFASEDLEWLLHRQIYTQAIDVVQLEYTPMAQYAGRYLHIVNALFEHDVYFQSIARGLAGAPGAKAAFEYLRALRYELTALPRMDRIQMCTAENREYLLTFLPRIAAKTQAGLRAAIDVSSYRFHSGRREPMTMLFVGSFRHLPNQVALEWFAGKVLPQVLERCPQARLVVAGSEMQANQAMPLSPAIDVLGCVANVREPLSRYTVFVCPVLSGSGVRVKLLEAFASGIPVVSTPLGAEGLARKDGEFCLLASEPQEFARRILEVFSNPDAVAEMAERARHEVAMHWNTRDQTAHLVESYRDALAEKREATSARFAS